jgi:hypothetical protein
MSIRGWAGSVFTIYASAAARTIAKTATGPLDGRALLARGPDFW